ncbi:MAG: helix-turn-helix transcriptional regulator [Bacteroidia bacterium]|jgi:transcriptional regulator with XRE-family HTH domain
MNFESFAFTLRRRREEYDLTQQELAQRSGINLRSINAIESGKANPSFSTLEKLAEVLNLELIIRRP